LRSAIALIYQIGDATSQSDKDGYFLRQFLQGVDVSGLPGGALLSGPPPSASSSQGLPALPQLPTLPQLPPLPQILPPAPTLPPIPGAPPLPGTPPTPPPSSQSAPPHPTPPGCVLGILCTGTASTTASFFFGAPASGYGYASLAAFVFGMAA
jgi:hypothetical protein